ncbi:MAG: cysteine--tRNA ligase [bacterium]
MRLYNTLTRQEDAFVPLRDNTVRMYTCGLTVYARGHIGNFRTFVSLDVLRRTLREVSGFGVRQVMNFTDVDDRTIIESQKAGVSLRDYTNQYIAAFREDAEALGLEPVEETPRATDEDNLRSMVEMIQALDANGHTYRSDGSVYFKISTLPDYGKLARLDHDGIQSGARVDADKYEKDDARDFVLWKATTEHEPTWDFGVGPGRPGWHIECSAMALRLLDGAPIDIHAGGVDLVFPHHENEIAQAEGATGKPFSRFWVHCEHLLLDEGVKMSKSLGNVFTVSEVLERGHRASTLRYVLLSVHYRKQLRFAWASLDQADEALKRLMACLTRIEGIAATTAGQDGEPHPELAERLEQASQAFGAKLEQDLNVPGALGVMFELVRHLNTAMDDGDLGPPDAQLALPVFERFDAVLGVMALRRAEEASPDVPVDEIEQLIADRKAARARRDFAAADGIRDDLDTRGVILEDTAAGTRWKRK